MPRKNGKECLKELKSHTTFNRIHVLIYSVSNNITDIDEVYENGAHYYVIKPYANVNFMETLKIIFNIDWTKEQPIPHREQFVINKAFI